MELLIRNYFRYILEEVSHDFSYVNISSEEKSSELYQHFSRNFNVLLDIKFYSFRINGGHEMSDFHVDSRARNRSLYETYITILRKDFSYRQIAEEIEPTKFAKDMAKSFSSNFSRKMEENEERCQEIISFYEKERTKIDNDSSLSLKIKSVQLILNWMRI